MDIGVRIETFYRRGILKYLSRLLVSFRDQMEKMKGQTNLLELWVDVRQSEVFFRRHDHLVNDALELSLAERWDGQ